MTKIINQLPDGTSKSDINSIWSRVWHTQKMVDTEKFFSSPFFISGFRAISKNIGTLNGKVLEAGGGTGRFGIELARTNKNCQIDIIDISEESINLAKRLARERGVFNVTCNTADIMALPFSDNTYDYIVSDAVIQVFQNYESAVAEMARVLRPKGIILISVCNFWNFHTFYKAVLSFIGKPYKYGYEKSFRLSELKYTIERCGLRFLRVDGFAVGYGITRLQYLPFRILGKLTDWFTFLGDILTDGYISRVFGFEILIIATKDELN